MGFYWFSYKNIDFHITYCFSYKILDFINLLYIYTKTSGSRFFYEKRILLDFGSESIFSSTGRDKWSEVRNSWCSKIRSYNILAMNTLICDSGTKKKKLRGWTGAYNKTTENRTRKLFISAGALFGPKKLLPLHSVLHFIPVMSVRGIPGRGRWPLDEIWTSV